MNPKNCRNIVIHQSTYDTLSTAKLDSGESLDSVITRALSALEGKNLEGNKLRVRI